MKMWVDDLRDPPDKDWVWAKSSDAAIMFLRACYFWQTQGTSDKYWYVQEMSLDHDLGGNDTTRPVVMWMCENDFWPTEISIHTQNPVGREWLQGMVERYQT